jgi:WD40 repeat protein
MSRRAVRLLAALLLTAAPVAAEPPRVDCNGDPLPAGALVRLGSARLRHGGKVSGVVYTPDVKTVISSAEYDVIRLWDAATGAPLGTLKTPEGGACGLAVSPDGKLLAAGNYDHSVSLWDLDNRREQRRLVGHPGRVWYLFFTPDGKTLVTAEGPCPSSNGVVCVWDVLSGKEQGRILTNQQYPWKPSLSPDGKTLVTNGSTNTGPHVHLWDVSSLKELRKYAPLSGHVSVAFAADGKTLVMADGDVLRFLDALMGEEKRKVEMPNWGGTELALSPDGKLLANREANCLVLRDAVNGALRARLDVSVAHFGGSGSRLTFAPDGKTLAYAGQYTIHLCDVKTARERVSADEPTEVPVAAQFTPDGRHVVIAHQWQWISVWDAGTGRLLRRFGVDFPTHMLNSAVLAPDGRTVAASYASGRANNFWVIWDTETGEELRRFPQGDSSLLDLRFTPDGRGLVSCGFRHSASLWDPDTGQNLHHFGEPSKGSYSASFDATGTLLAMADWDGTPSLFRFADRSPLHSIPTPFHVGGPAVLSPDGRTLAATTHGQFILVEVATGQRWVEKTIPDPGRRFPSHAVAFSPNGRLVAWGGLDDTVLLLDAVTGEECGRLTGHPGEAKRLAFSPDGTRLLSGGEDGTSLVWNVPYTPPQSPLTLDGAWTALAAADTATGRRAMARFAHHTDADTLRFLREQLRPVPRAGEDRIKALIRDLDHEDFDTRERTTKELTALVASAAPALRTAAKDSPSLEVRRRAGEVLAQLPDWRFPLRGEAARLVRAVEALEMGDTPERRQLLKALADGAPDHLLTREAAAALNRLERR